jgi:hypothetical protein
MRTVQIHLLHLLLQMATPAQAQVPGMKACLQHSPTAVLQLREPVKQEHKRSQILGQTALGKLREGAGGDQQ